MNIKIPRKNSKKIIIILSILVALVLISLVAYLYLNNKESGTNYQDNSLKQSDNTINYNPPSDEDIEHSQDAKKRAEETQPQQGDDKLPASIGIAFADKEGDNFEVRAFTSSVIEGTGTCTAILTNGSKTVKKSSKAFVDVSTSQCQPILVPLNELTPNGDWNFNVEYSSPTSSGASQIEVIKI